MNTNRFPAPAPTTPESQQIVADVWKTKALARARRIARWMEMGMLPECARAEAHLLQDVNAAMSDEGFDRIMARIDHHNLLNQMDSDAEISDELEADIRIKNLVLWAKYN